MSPVVASEISTSASIPRGQSPLLWASLMALLEGLPTSARVLDCGGGSGSLAVPLASRGADVTVVDVSADALGTLARRAAEAGVSERVHSVQGDAEFLSSLVGRNQFDLVLAHDVLANLASVPAALAEIATVLNAGSVASLLVANPVAAVLHRASSGDLSGALAAFNRRHASVSDLSALAELCEQAGLRVESTEGIGVLSDLIPGQELDRAGATQTLRELESVLSGVSPFRDIASRLHVVARKPAGTG
ncbi:MAG: Methyltransferase type 11 [Frankiales bacterium]|nr:Methyltransferase type 11 [Frankiales bacterium]